MRSKHFPSLELWKKFSESYLKIKATERLLNERSSNG